MWQERSSWSSCEEICFHNTTEKVRVCYSGFKIGGSIALLTGGGLVGGAILYSYNDDFRKFVNESLPIIETFNLALGPVTGSNNDIGQNGEEKSLLKPRNAELKPIIDSKKNVAIVSSIDQIGVSSVDLDIAAKVEDEVEQAQKDTPPDPKGPPKPPGGGQESIASFISAVDQPGVSAVDQDITRVGGTKTEENSTHTESVKPHSKEEVIHSTHIDTSLTEKELEHMIDQTAMEVLVHEALSFLKQTAQDAVAAQKKATELLLNHVKQLKSALEMGEQGSMKELSKTVLKTQKEAEDAINEAKACQIKVNQEIEKVHAVIKEAEASGAHEAGVKASKEAARVSYEVLTAAAELQKAKSEDMVLGEHKKFLDESKSILKKELEEILPGALKEDKGKKGAKSEDTKSEAVLLAYARKRLEHLKQQLSSQREEEQKRLEQVLSVQREEDNKLADIKMKQELDKLTAEFGITQKKRESELASEHETALRQQLRRQAAAYSDHLAEVLNVQAHQLQERYHSELNEKITHEKESYSSKLNTALSRLRGIENAVDSRADAEKSNKKSQELWLACQALQSAIDRGIKALKPLYLEVGAITSAAPDDPVINGVIGAVPQEALQRGIYTEKTLAARFPGVKQSCRRVAMVGDDNRGPWTYFLSFIQSFFIFDKFDPRVDDETVDLESMDTFEILARAEYYVLKGDLELSARFVNQLKGEPRKLAYDWLREVRLLLETRQAARFLSSYAAAAGMKG
ncbi:hypothetical protein QZH41_009314 [Actinostola sp. cb2023]|nr:hypothetical protein QZH41_009314 [Actinostola sp. cb2023]